MLRVSRQRKRSALHQPHRRIPMLFKTFTKFAALAMVLALATGSATLAVAAEKKLHNVVFHVTDNDPAKWNQILNNINNLHQALGKKHVTIAVVANGTVVTM